MMTRPIVSLMLSAPAGATVEGSVMVAPPGRARDRRGQLLPLPAGLRARRNDLGNRCDREEKQRQNRQKAASAGGHARSSPTRTPFHRDGSDLHAREAMGIPGKPLRQFPDLV